MSQLSNNDKLKKAKVAFGVALTLTAFSLFVFIKAIEADLGNKIVTAGFGFAGFLTMTIIVFVKILKLKKEE